MRKRLLLLRRGVFFVSSLVMFQFTFGQQSPIKQVPVKGHKLYKQTKIYDSRTGPSDEKPQAIGDNALDRILYEQQMLQNPFTKRIPEGIRGLELEFSKSFKKLEIANESRSFSNWKNRGPYNIGGRTRALAIDRLNENVILAGGVSGGLWRSENSGETWRKVTRNFQSPSITCIAQDPRRGRGFTWYYGSGERYGNSASAGGAFYTGSGLYKSQDGGRTWEPVRSTFDNDNTTSSISPFDIINSIAIHPLNGDVYVATFNGVHRSRNGGQSFEEVLEGGFDSWTEVIITPSGKIYATINFFGTDSNGESTTGFYVSNDGNNWANITPPEGIAPTFPGRTIMEADPSNENTVYFFTEDLETGGAFLYRYDAAASSENQWVDLTGNLPTSIGGRVGNLNIQGGYNMVIEVHPENSNIVFVGGTNLYRSETGFTTPAGQESWIGGYSTANDVSVYTNHHPDQHNLLFYPSNPDKVLSGNDGGVQVTENIMANDGAEPVTWTSLNNGYVTTQPYTVSFDPDTTSDDLIAGFQDNGTWFSNSTDPKTIWEEYFGGDGSYNAIADNGLSTYLSSQRGNIYRFNFDEAGNFISFARVTPSGPGGNFSFVNPFILDPNNDNIMYLPAGDRVWRNNDLDELPLFSNATTDVNWVEQVNTITPDQSTITALDVSKFPVANRLYYGTNSGLIYKIDNANLDNQDVVDVSTGKGLPPGFVNNITVDPTNSDRVFVVFSNYGIPSVFLSENAGESWTDISGNLEQNRDGSGNGASVRWLAIKGNNEGYYVGTSTGLYSTDRIFGQHTVWRPENNVIGNAVVSMVKTRKDGFVALASHGNGLFSAKFRVRPRPEPTLSVQYLLDDYSVAVNSEASEIDITDLFAESNGRNISIEVINSNPSLVSAFVDGNTLHISYTPDSVGEATIGLVASSGNQQVSEGFTVSVREPTLYDQLGPVTFSSPSQLLTDLGTLVQSADDFTVPEGAVWSVESIIALGDSNSTLLNNATVVIYNNDNGFPGEEIYNSGEIAPVSEPDDVNLNLVLPEPVEFEAGSYWLSVYVNLDYLPNATLWSWSTQSNVTGFENVIKDEFDLFGLGATDWTPQSVAYQFTPEDHVFQLYGSADVISETNTEQLESERSLATLDAKILVKAWPNPSTSEFHFETGDLFKNSITMKVYNIAGQVIFEKENVGKSYTWNTQNAPKGIYLVNFSDGLTNRLFKVVKK